jgi:hypothetical protein
MEPVTPESLAQFLTRLGESCPHPAVLYLVGGSALRLLGSPRETLDVDYMADAPPEAAQELRQAMPHLAAEMRLDLEDKEFHTTFSRPGVGMANHNPQPGTRNSQPGTRNDEPTPPHRILDTNGRHWRRRSPRCPPPLRFVMGKPP